MKYTERIVGKDLESEYNILGEMEAKYEEKDVHFFNQVLKDGTVARCPSPRCYSVVRDRR